MKLPIDWLSEYSEIKHNNSQIGDIFTYLEFMQDGPIVDNVLDLEIRQNRPDALSIIGLATEYSAKNNSKIEYPKQIDNLNFEKPDKLINPKTTDQIKRFTAVKIDGVKIGKSPDYIINRLTLSGIRTVNNIVDITNYVMLEYGIPMHVFDANLLGNNPQLTLRMGNTNDELETWLGEKIKISKNDIVITNSENKVVSIGGITGEKNTGATDTTISIIIEAANYNQALIRKSAIEHNLLTDSANRHTKFLPSNLVETAIKRACYLISELCGGEITLAEDYYPEVQVRFEITLNLDEVERIGGLKVTANDTEQILKNLKYDILENSNNKITVQSPNHRTDVTQPVDVIEDILRIIGYENIKEQQINLAPPADSTPEIYTLEDNVRDILVGMGLDEHITEPLVKFDADITRIKLENSLNSEKNSLRISIQETLIPVLTNYIKHKHNSIKLFEVGKIYKTEKDQIIENSVVGVLISNSNSYKSAKGILDLLFNKLGYNNFYLTSTDDKKIINLMLRENNLGFIKFANNRTIYFEINLDRLLNIEKATNEKLITKVPFEHEQIVNLVVNKNILFSEIQKIIDQVKSNTKDINVLSNFLEDYSDEILNNAEKKSYLLSLKIQSLVSPVSKEDFKPIKEKVLDLLNKNLGITLKIT